MQGFLLLTRCCKLWRSYGSTPASHFNFQGDLMDTKKLKEKEWLVCVTRVEYFSVKARSKEEALVVEHGILVNEVVVEKKAIKKTSLIF